MRDRERLHALVDATLVGRWRGFGTTLGERIVHAMRDDAESAARSAAAENVAIAALGGEPGSGAWSRGLAHGLAVATAFGMAAGPNARLVAAISAHFGERPERVMKRELGAALRAEVLPAFSADLDAYLDALVRRGAAAFAALDAMLARDLSSERDAALDPFARATERSAAVRAERAARLLDVERGFAAVRIEDEGGETRPVAPAGRRDDVAPPFDEAAYVRGVASDRYRIAIVGALGRGKATLIDAFAGANVAIGGGIGPEAHLPVHVRFGETSARAACDGAVIAEATWDLPRELELVRVPAFDSGAPDAEAIAFFVAAQANEIVALFSRQLSSAELALYGRLAERGIALTFVHTLADNETAHERRSVVSLAQRYLTERGIAASRVYTVSARDAREARANGRATAAWNEFAALRESLATRAASEAARLARLRAAAAVAPVPRDPTVPKQWNLGRLFRLR